MTATSPSRHLVTTAPRRTNCLRCRRIVLDGIADGMAYRIDAIPLNLTGEVAVRLANLMTYRLRAGRFTRRDQYDVALDAKHGRPAVAATHSCTPLNPAHVDPQHATTFAALVADDTNQATDSQDREQNSLFVITGAFAGARVIAIPADDPPPF